MEERALVLAARAGEHDACALLAGRARARDAVQEAMVKAWRDLPGLRDPERWDAFQGGLPRG